MHLNVLVLKEVSKGILFHLEVRVLHLKSHKGDLVPVLIGYLRGTLQPEFKAGDFL